MSLRLLIGLTVVMNLGALIVAVAFRAPEAFLGWNGPVALMWLIYFVDKSARV